ncbi:MAG: sigma-54 dependent transcriptional regulator [Polyangiales bacterium]
MRRLRDDHDSARPGAPDEGPRGREGDGEPLPPATDPAAFKLTLKRTSSGKIVGQHPRIREVLDTIERVATTDVNVLVTGECGTGKELFVAALHDASTRAGTALVPINCGAIPPSLIESHLFGHLRGAFTGAEHASKGAIGAAEGGTLFLDEVGDLPLDAQVKLLRVIQNREYTPVGASEPRRCDIRVVAATNRDLEKEVAAGRFREDLYYRLNVVHVSLPPLRERGSDIDLLAFHFLRHFAQRFGRPEMSFRPEALDALRQWPWKGNIRELENVVQRAVAIARGPVVALADLKKEVRENYRPSDTTPPPNVTASVFKDSLSITFEVHGDEEFDLPAAIAHLKQRVLAHALERAGGNYTQAARLVGLKRTTFLAMIKQSDKPDA